MGMLDKVAGAAIPAEMTDMLTSSVRNMDAMADKLGRVVSLLEELVAIELEREGKHPNGSGSSPRNGHAHTGRAGRQTERAAAS